MEDSNLVKARSSIVWILALATAFGAVWWIERESARQAASQAAAATAASAPAAQPQPIAWTSGLPGDPAPRPLTDQEKAWARTAWTYFERNTQASTGLVGSVEGFPSATLWDMASALLATVSARDLDLIDAKAFDERMGKALESLAKLPLHAGALPNKSYDVQSLGMTDYANQPSPNGIGWSAIDLARLAVPLHIVVWRHPQHAPAARAVLARWKLGELARGGELFGMRAEGNGPQAVQEGRLGYEQYAARALALLGLDVAAASDWRRHLKLATVDGVQVCADARDPKLLGAPTHVLSEPYVLAGLELGWDRWTRECAWRVYKAQEARFARTGILTAVSEDHVDQAPYFVYGTVHSGGRDWVTVSDKGADAPQLRNLSVKAAFGWHALLGTDYTGKLVQAVAALHEPGKGWYAGLYEEGGKPNKAITANTNAVVLESLAYIARGKAVHLQ